MWLPKQFLLARFAQLQVGGEYLDQVFHFILGEGLLVSGLLLLVGHGGVVEGDLTRRVGHNPAL